MRSNFEKTVAAVIREIATSRRENSQVNCSHARLSARKSVHILNLPFGFLTTNNGVLCLEELGSITPVSSINWISVRKSDIKFGFIGLGGT